MNVYKQMYDAGVEMCQKAIQESKTTIPPVSRYFADKEDFDPTPPPPPNALYTQVGGDYYTKLPIQPMEYSMANKLDACQHTIIKYVTRFRDKNGIEDLEKAKHVIDMLIAFEEKRMLP